MPSFQNGRAGCDSVLENITVFTASLSIALPIRNFRTDAYKSLVGLCTGTCPAAAGRFGLPVLRLPELQSTEVDLMTRLISTEADVPGATLKRP